jgi:hypothetical protein
MAGEDTTVHIAAMGRIAGPAQIRCIADPRLRDDQYRLFEWLGCEIEAYFRSCRSGGYFPQFWLSSGAAVAHLDTLADRLRYNRDNKAVRRLGELLSYNTERYPIHAQQALITASDALSLHFATGQQEGEDEHLGALLTWIEPPKDRDVLAAVALAEDLPMGVKTDPTFDRDVLSPLVEAFNEARRKNASQVVLNRHQASIQGVLEPIVMRIYQGVQRAIHLLSSATLPALPGMQAITNKERNEFENFMAARDNGIPLPLRDKPKGAAFRLAEREDARENLESAIIHGDRIGRARARISGDCLRGTVQNAQQCRVGPRRFRHLFEVVSSQRVLRIRRRDELALLSDPRLVAVVQDVRRTGRTTVVLLETAKGKRCVGLPANGRLVELGPHPPQWDRIIRVRGQMKSRLISLPWTHQDRGMPPATPRVTHAPNSAIAAVEALR